MGSCSRPKGEGYACTSGADVSEIEDADMAFPKSLFFKNKSGKRKGPSTSTPNPKSRAVESTKSAKKNPRKKTKGGAGAEEPRSSFRALKGHKKRMRKDEAFIERMHGRGRNGKQKTTAKIFNGCIGDVRKYS